MAMSQFSERGKRPIFPMHIKMAAGTVLYVSICLDTNEIRILNVTTGEWRAPVECESQEETIKKQLNSCVAHCSKVPKAVRSSYDNYCCWA